MREEEVLKILKLRCVNLTYYIMEKFNTTYYLIALLPYSLPQMNL